MEKKRNWSIGGKVPTIIVYGISLSLLILILKFAEYKYFIHELSMEVYIEIIAVICTAIGVWIGLKLIGKNRKKNSNENFVRNDSTLESLKISKREYEVLELMSDGCSNQEIADKLFISIPTVKTHSSNLFEKLKVHRRTQAISRARELQIIP